MLSPCAAKRFSSSGPLLSGTWMALIFTTAMSSGYVAGLARQREAPVRELLDEAVDEQRVEAPGPLGGVGEPRGLERLRGHRARRGAQDVEQAAAHLPVGARPGLGPAHRAVPRRATPLLPGAAVEDRAVRAP